MPEVKLPPAEDIAEMYLAAILEELRARPSVAEALVVRPGDELLVRLPAMDTARFNEAVAKFDPQFAPHGIQALYMSGIEQLGVLRTSGAA